MRVKKVLNNCVVLALSDKGQEVVLMGNAIGYKYKADDSIDLTSIDKTFFQLDHQWSHHFLNLLSNTPNERFDLTNAIIEYGKQSIQAPLNDSIYVTLMDHINFMFERYHQNLQTQNRLYWDVKCLYPKEFQIGTYALLEIEKRTGIQLYEDEAANIALHFVNAENGGKGLENVISVTECVRDILQIIRYHFQTSFDEESINFFRLVTHLQFFITRLLERNIIQNGDDFLYQQVRKKYAKEFSCVLRIQDYTQQHLTQSLSHDEMVYLCIHIHRIFQS